MIGVKSDQAVNSAIEAIVRWDPKSATEAELRTMEQHLDALGRQVAEARMTLDKEKREADAIAALSQQRMAAAEQIQRRMDSETDPTRKGELEQGQRAILGDIEGIVLLDGTWSQAKALWWRNAWMLKCQRVILGPKHPSRYGQLRREPRRDGLSTIEAAAMLLSSLEKRPDIAETLHSSFERMLVRYREAQSTMPELAPKPKPKRDYRRRKRA